MGDGNQKLYRVTEWINGHKRTHTYKQLNTVLTKIAQANGNAAYYYFNKHNDQWTDYIVLAEVQNSEGEWEPYDYPFLDEIQWWTFWTDFWNPDHRPKGETK